MSVADDNTNTDILIAGAFAALSVDLLVYPLDTIKTRIQAPNYKTLYTTSNGAVDRALFRGLYQGVFSVILVTVPSSGAFFTTYEASKSLFHRLNTTLPQQYALPTPLLHSAASAIAEAVSCLILTPAEVIKQNAQVIKKTSKGSGSKSGASSGSQPFDVAATRTALSKFSHPNQLWRGYTALLARNLPFTAMHFPLFEGLKGRLIEWRRTQQQHQHQREDKDQSSSSSSLIERGLLTGLAAGISGSFAAVVTTPVDVVKTRIMLAAASPSPPSHSPSSSSSSSSTDSPSTSSKTAKQADISSRQSGLAIGKDIWRREGVRGLFRGGLLRGVWTAVGSALYLSVYESGRAYLADRRSKDHV